MPWRPMTSPDLDRVQELADRIHVDHPEDRDVLAERLELYPAGCHVLEEGGSIVGYALTHPWRFGEPPPLNERLRGIPPVPTTYYIHDVALLPGGRGKGHAADIAERVAEHARSEGFTNMSLVAVNGSRRFWERLGFRAEAVPGLETKLLSYGSDATLMVRDLTTAGRR
ncbi:GNAT family N-acetyltransferase [Microvirga lenta]|uniref:GNAT family N-acetyltransferase n=1 Tax=Microvirga lenta TaxID=2881337 RepID=UPI001CFFD0CB|nr:GNAT family N-acetyltransferase [Microvirga lenta]MCB5176315.1 GNAT family N-acetyltransferase [Microvirga lenta]